MIRNLPRRSFKLNWLFQLETVCLTSKFRPLFRHSVEELTRAFSVPRIRSPGMFPKSLGQLRTVSVFHWQFLITYIFSVSLKFGSMLHHGSMGRVQSKECYFMFTYTFSVFFIKKCDFIIFISFLDEVSNLSTRIWTNQKPESVVRNCQRNWTDGILIPRAVFKKSSFSSSSCCENMARDVVVRVPLTERTLYYS